MNNNYHPTFIIIGAAKSATTSIFKYFSEHPEVGMSYTKEARYFCYDSPPEYKGYGKNGASLMRKYDKTLPESWNDYQNYFSEVENFKARGEASPAYLYVHDTARKIKVTLKDVKIIVILRNPIERAYSSYLHMVREGAENLPFLEALKIEKTRVLENAGLPWRYVSMGLYSQQLKEYYKYFDENSIKVIFYDDFKEKPIENMQILYNFIDVKSDFIPNTSKKLNTSQKNIRIFGRALKLPIINKVKKLFIGKSSETVYSPPSMDAESRQFLIDHLKADIRQLGEMTGRDLNHWLDGQKG